MANVNARLRMLGESPSFGCEYSTEIRENECVVLKDDLLAFCRRYDAQREALQRAYELTGFGDWHEAHAVLRAALETP